MNASVLLPLHESMVQHGAGKHDRWRGNMTGLVISDGMMNSITIHTVGIHLMIRCVVHTLQVWFHKEVHWMLAIH
jgi:hypothetical protein